MAFFRTEKNTKKPVKKEKTIIALSNGKADNDDEDEDEMFEEEQKLALAEQKLEFMKSQIDQLMKEIVGLQKQLADKDEFMYRVIFELIAMKGAAPAIAATTADRYASKTPIRPEAKDVTKTPDVSAKLPG